MILPIDAHLAAAVAAVRAHGALVLTAAPGAGKSTRLPPALLAVASGQVLLLQPRRIAARTLARRIADERGGRLGDEVGYQVRFDKVGGERTRLWVLTEGLLSRRIQADPLLAGVGAVILDEFHERSIHTDLVLAHLAELRRGLRPDLLVVVMSATLDPRPVARFLGDCPVIDVPAPVHPVTVRHQPVDRQTRLEEAVAAVLATALAADDHGDVLVFLPGTGEIRACQARLGGLPGLTVLPLHSGLPADEQDRALAPAPPGTTKIVLATNVAETALTIPGIRTVIDTGLVRIDRFDPERGLDQLVLEDCSQASATQRAGRAGRTAPGRCWKLWSQVAEARRPAATDPEVHRVDLAPTLLLLKGWHGADPRSFPWFDPPAAQRLDHGEDLLALLGATAAPWSPLTALGERLADLPVHPRLGRLLLSAAAVGQAALGATVAALIEGRELRLRDAPGAGQPVAGEADVLDRIARLEHAERLRFEPALRSQGTDPVAAREAARIRDDLLRMVAVSTHRQPGRTDPGPADAQPAHLPRLLLSAFPDRVGRRSAPGANRGMLTGGIAVEIDPASCLANRPGERKSELFCATLVHGLSGRRALGSTTIVRQGCLITEDDLAAVAPTALRREDRVRYDAGLGRVTSQAGTWYRDLALRLSDGAQADPERIAACLAEALAPQAEALIAAEPEAAAWLARLRWLVRLCALDRAADRRRGPGQLPALADLPELSDAVLAELIAGCCAGHRTRAEVEAEPKLPRLEGLLTWQQRQMLERLAPSHWTAPTGSRLRLDYAPADDVRGPVLAVRLQELFGLAETPTVADGALPVTLHLLGPNYRVEQVTTDLASFWANTYPQVRKDLRGRYPKHSWPDDPLTAPAVCKGRPTRG